MSDRETTDDPGPLDGRQSWDEVRTALWRLRRWRDGGDMPGSYMPASGGFGHDVKALLAEVERLHGLRGVTHMVLVADSLVPRPTERGGSVTGANGAFSMDGNVLRCADGADFERVLVVGIEQGGGVCVMADAPSDAAGLALQRAWLRTADALLEQAIKDERSRSDA